MQKGVDLSNYQGTPDFNLLKSQVDFAILKASEGTGYEDPTFKTNQANLRNSGLLRGFYHFARPDLGNSAQSEADYFLSIIGQLQEGEILVLDYEVNFTDPVGWCKAFLDEIYSKTNCKPLIYLNLSLVNGHDWSSVINSGYGLWLADYDGVENDAPNTPWPLVAMKQWTSSGSLNGISGNVDRNTFFGDATAFKAYGYRPIAPQPTQPVVPPIQFTDQTIIPIGINPKTQTNFTGELQAVRSSLFDLENSRDNLANQLSVLQNTQTSPKTTPKTDPMPEVDITTSPTPAIDPSSQTLGGFLLNLVKRFLGR